MKLSQVTLLATVFITPSSAFVVYTNPTARTRNYHLAAVDAALAIDPSVIIAGAAAAVAAVGGVVFTNMKGTVNVNGATAVMIEESTEPKPIDVSIPYDAAATLAYNQYVTSSSNNKVDFEQFKSLYYSQMVAEVKAKVQEGKVNEMKMVLSELEGDAADIKQQIEVLFDPSKALFAETESAPVAAKVAEPVAAAPVASVDISVDYNAAAKLAYEASDKSTDFESFRALYEEDTVAMVAAKNPFKN